MGRWGWDAIRSGVELVFNKFIISPKGEIEITADQEPCAVSRVVWSAPYFREDVVRASLRPHSLELKNGKCPLVLLGWS